MKKLKLIFLPIALIVLTCGYSNAQTITVLSASDKTPVLFAHVIIKPLDIDINEQVFLTDTTGVTKIPSQFSGIKSLVAVSCLGYEKLIDTLLLNGNKTYYLKSQHQVLNEIVITGQYAPNSPEKAVHKIKIIDRKKIDAMGAQNLRDVLTNELNIRVSQDNILGSSMSIQGISGENVKILIDGVPVIGRTNGSVDLSQINLNNIERIEVIEGPMSVNYGTNALAGTVNLITKKTQKNTVETSINSYYESSGWYNLSGKAGFYKKRNTILLSGGRNYFDGWNPNDKATINFKPQLADSNRYQSWKPKEQVFGDLQYIYKFSKLSLNYKGGYFYEKITNKGYPRAPYSETAFDDYYRTYRTDNAIFLNGKIASNKNINVQLTYNDYKRVKNTYYRDLTTLDKILTGTTSEQDTTTFNLISARGTYSTSKDSAKINYELGYDINVENGSGQRIKDKKQQIGDYAFFITAEYKPIEKLTFRPGFRYAYNTTFKAPLIPSLNVRYQLNDSHTFRFSYARGFRAPALKELYFYFIDINHYIIGNESLKAEYSHNLNLSMNYSAKRKNILWKTESSIFYNYIENLITLAQTTGTQYSYINIGLYKTIGAQITAELAWEHLKFNIGGSYTGRYNNLTEDYHVKEFSWSPEGRSNIFYEFKKINLTVGLFYKYTARLPAFILENNEVKEIFIGDYHTADFSISKLFWKKKINLSVGTKNLFNVQNVNASTYSGSAHSSGSGSVPVGTGRTYFIKLDLNLHSKK